MVGMHKTLDKRSNLYEVGNTEFSTDEIMVGVPSPIKREDLPEKGVEPFNAEAS